MRGCLLHACRHVIGRTGSTFGNVAEKAAVVVFLCNDFMLSVFWNTSEGTPDEVIVEEAASWFKDRYGMNPLDYDVTVSIEVVPPRQQVGGDSLQTAVIAGLSPGVMAPRTGRRRPLCHR